jgi:hypothetical protein
MQLNFNRGLTLIMSFEQPALYLINVYIRYYGQPSQPTVTHHVSIYLTRLCRFSVNWT